MSNEMSGKNYVVVLSDGDTYDLVQDCSLLIVSDDEWEEIQESGGTKWIMQEGRGTCEPLAHVLKVD